jgi:hypothetical protein
MFKNNIVTNPVAWAEDAVGSRIRYAMMIALTILMGSATIVLVILTSKDWQIGLVVSTPMILFAMELPLCYLRALRRLVDERGSASS